MDEQGRESRKRGVKREKEREGERERGGEVSGEGQRIGGGREERGEGKDMRHMKERVKGIDEVEGREGEGNAEKGNRRQRGEDEGKERGAAGEGDDREKAAIERLLREVEKIVGHAVRGNDHRLVRHVEFLQN
ncbi:hypothetical protein OIV71_32400, partial [Burkholderia pseudomallei]